MYPITIGDIRVLEFLFPLEFNRYFLRYKLIHIAILPLIYLLINNFIKDFKFFKQKDFLKVWHFSTIFKQFFYPKN